jgi:hypothetical protein
MSARLQFSQFDTFLRSLDQHVWSREPNDSRQKSADKAALILGHNAKIQGNCPFGRKRRGIGSQMGVGQSIGRAHAKANVHFVWAIEELLLEPCWVHYIPLAEDLVDVEEKIQWMIDNDDRARHIADRGAFCGCWISLFTRMLLGKNSSLNKIFCVDTYGAHFAERPSE